MRSRLSTYLHPLAGRPLAWHTVSALAGLLPSPRNLYLLSGPELPPELFGGLATEVRTLSGTSAGLEPAELADRVLLVDAAAPAIASALPRLLQADEDTYLPAPDGRLAAALLGRDTALAAIESGRPLRELGERDGLTALQASGDTLIVSDRQTLAAAARLLRDRLVEKLMAGGVTFLLPESVLVDVDVRIGRDSIVYPGAILEGQTTVGEETVIGPGCRIIDSWIGSGVELKGWNFISRASIRNRAILEPYVRRGFD